MYWVFAEVSRLICFMAAMYAAKIDAKLCKQYPASLHELLQFIATVSTA
jgi:hypothetical protein